VIHEFRLTLDRMTATGPTAPGIIAEATGVCFGRASDQSVTVAILGEPGHERQAAELADAYLQGGGLPTVCAACQVGAVVMDHTTGVATIVAPPIGLRQIYWSAEAGTCSVASDPRGLSNPLGRSLAVRPEALFNYIYFHMLPGPGTFFSGVEKLDGGHTLRWNGRDPVVSRYWRPRFDDAPAISEADARDELFRLLHSAVERSLQGRASAGAFLSGGLDSSTVAGLASEQRPGIPTISMGFDASGYDEMEFARIASRHFKTTPLEYYVTPDDVLSTLPEIAAAFPEPFGNSSAAAAYHCARIAREQGIDLLLAGDGGDELFGGNERYAKQLVFERYSRVPRRVRSALLEPLVNAAGRVTRAFPIGKAVSYIEQANVPLPDRLQTYNFLHRHDPSEVFAPELLEQMDASRPLHLLRDEYGVPGTRDAVNHMLFLDWKFTLHDNDLVKVNAMCQLAGVEVAYPMLDQTVVDFSLRLPANWKVRNGQLRWFYKRAMRDFLPRQIVTKTKHGFGLPFGVWTRTHEGLRRLSEDALGSLAERGYFRPEFLREALRLHRNGHASYYGELVWILMVLELWLQAHSGASSGRQ
jgi:asparagine synthase (glutamine-hydrolysing)